MFLLLYIYSSKNARRCLDENANNNKCGSYFVLPRVAEASFCSVSLTRRSEYLSRDSEKSTAGTGNGKVPAAAPLLNPREDMCVAERTDRADNGSTDRAVDGSLPGTEVGRGRSDAPRRVCRLRVISLLCRILCRGSADSMKWCMFPNCSSYICPIRTSSSCCSDPPESPVAVGDGEENEDRDDSNSRRWLSRT